MVVVALPFRVTAEVPGKIEDPFAGEFVLSEVALRACQTEGLQMICLRRLSSRRSPCAERTGFPFQRGDRDLQAAHRTECRYANAKSRPWRFCDADALRGYSTVRSAAFPVVRAKASETPRGPRPGALRPLWVCLVPIRAPAKAVRPRPARG